MPGGDRTGPRGQGSKTGRGMGFCGGARAPGFGTPGLDSAARGLAGGGWGRGGGRGRGWRHRNLFHATGLTGWQRALMAAAPAAHAAEGAPLAPPAAADSQGELAMLKQQADGLAATLGELQRRIEQLQGGRSTPEPVVAQSAG